MLDEGRREPEVAEGRPERGDKELRGLPEEAVEGRRRSEEAGEGRWRPEEAVEGWGYWCRQQTLLLKT